ncbi:3,4-dihydroxy-2-butanone 4-phosphate synthase [Candidatus Methylobacter favarea]|uniref:3,4-dihydroxy-2-butanone 4-phosphate synthase n=1 Tax=Candidatus Methylobacter favarea TaxID=2707345 RepID=A0A8S0WAA3_9GAMM|nr:bifunctional 3,4-dihydroxy-2-butanone-4-phosphate synthase/GTP cyclohydrolase II [Candidatus Methylobacter favarea]CAA9890589.1 3,4-dihydroxy-2-butanone 4-phosphate synthase [Candidatus Methylobacter favarea]
MNTIEEIIAELRAGKMVVIMDDEDRENEGDLVMAASFTRPEDINFMARYGRGLICLTLTSERCQQLRLPLMVNENKTAHSTNFTVSIEAAAGVTTGISAADRARTVQCAVAADAKADDLVQPGHIFPLMAMPGGVLNRAGHTEAGCDLARLSGVEPAAVIVEILNEDGSMARRPDLEAFAEQHHLKIGTIADLIHYRIQHENTLERISECNFPTEFGDFRLYAYQDRNDNNVHLAMVMGQISGDKPVLVRVHARNLLDDVFASKRSDSTVSIREAMQKIAEEGCGVLVVIRQSEDNKSLVELIHHYQLEDHGILSSVQNPEATDWRMTGTGARILADLGVHKLKVLGTKKKYVGLSGFDLEVSGHVSYDRCDAVVSENNIRKVEKHHVDNNNI